MQSSSGDPQCLAASLGDEIILESTAYFSYGYLVRGPCRVGY